MLRTLLLALVAIAVVSVVLTTFRPRSSRSGARFSPGDRIRVVEAGFWADGSLGTIAIPPTPVAKLAGDWRGHVRMVMTTSGEQAFYWVELDEPRPDADGDGLYAEAEIAERSLSPMVPPARP